MWVRGDQGRPHALAPGNRGTGVPWTETGRLWEEQVWRAEEMWVSVLDLLILFYS